MIEITKKEAIKLHDLCPEYVHRTAHRRHYYYTVCRKSLRLLTKVRQELGISKERPSKRGYNPKYGKSQETA